MKGEVVLDQACVNNPRSQNGQRSGRNEFLSSEKNRIDPKIRKTSVKHVAEHQSKEEREGHQREDCWIQLLIGRQAVVVSDLLKYLAYWVFPDPKRARGGIYH